MKTFFPHWEGLLIERIPKVWTEKKRESSKISVSTWWDRQSAGGRFVLLERRKEKELPLNYLICKIKMAWCPVTIPWGRLDRKVCFLLTELSYRVGEGSGRILPRNGCCVDYLLLNHIVWLACLSYQDLFDLWTLCDTTTHSWQWWDIDGSALYRGRSLWCSLPLLIPTYIFAYIYI